MKSKKFVLAALVLLAAITMALLPLAGCKNDSVSEAHTHIFDEKNWESDATGHWRPATCGHTEEKGGFASHTFGDWEVETESTDIAAGKPVKKCTTCSWTDEMEIPAGFVYIPAGTFKMGMGSEAEGVADDEKPEHEVTISKGYFMGRHEVTQKEWAEVMKDNANGISEYPSNFKNSPAENEEPKEGGLPVEMVSWYDAVVYCNRRSIAEDLTPCYTIGGKTNPDEWGTVPTSSDDPWEVTCDWEANGYRLPTEAEWEYAARAGDDTTNARTWSGTKVGDDLENYAWYSKNSDRKTHQVGTLHPNEWGLYDMSGNVWERCWDWYGDYSTESVTNPTDPTGGSSGSIRVFRGGGWCDDAGNCTVSLRNCNFPSIRGSFLGFRLVRSAN